MNVLIVYATARGSTAGIAKRVAERLAGAGLIVVTRAVDEVLEDDIAAADALVFGSAIHSGQWLPEADRFVHTRVEAVSGKPIWAFSVSSVGAEESFFPRPVAAVMRKFAREPDAVGRLRDAADVRGYRSFAGAVEGKDWGRAGTMFLRLLGGKTGDHRNWPAIDRWGDELARQLRSR